MAVHLDVSVGIDILVSTALFLINQNVHVTVNDHVSTFVASWKGRVSWPLAEAYINGPYCIDVPSGHDLVCLEDAA